jgi:hypothetical protein
MTESSFGYYTMNRVMQSDFYRLIPANCTGQDA